MPVHPLCLELMPDFQPTSEVICSSHLFLDIILLTDHDSVILQDTVPAPLARTILYKIEGPISALGCRSPTLAQPMSSHAVLDPTLIRPVSDKRKAPSLVASSTVKKKRTRKRLVIQVRTPSSPEHNAILHSDHLYLCMISYQNTATSGYYRFCQCFMNC
jgi:hypothetical protein